MFKPLHNFVVIEVETQEATKAGIILTNKKPLPTAKVISISEQVDMVKPGDRVILNKYSPLEVEYNEEKISLIDVDDIYGIIED